MDRIERIESPRPHERTWAVTPLRDRKQQEREREQQRRKPPEPPAPRPHDDDEPPHLVDVQA
jgi:hypothetical protein